MKVVYALFFMAAMPVGFAGCVGGENAQDAGANVESSEGEVTAPVGSLPYTETIYGSRQKDGGTLATDGM